MPPLGLDKLLISIFSWPHTELSHATGAEHYADDLEALLEQAMSEDFSVQLEDGSAILVAKQLVRACMLVLSCLRTQSQETSWPNGGDSRCVCGKSLPDAA